MKLSFTSAAAAMLLFILAVPAHAATLENSRIGKFLKDIIEFIDSTLVPLLFAVAFIVFLWGVFNYFIAGGADEEKRDKGKKFVVWGLVGFFIMVSVWGLVNLLTQTFGFNKEARPDLPSFNGSGSSNDDNTSGSNEDSNPFVDTNSGAIFTGGGGNPSPGSEDGF